MLKMREWEAPAEGFKWHDGHSGQNAMSGHVDGDEPFCEEADYQHLHTAQALLAMQTEQESRGGWSQKMVVKEYVQVGEALQRGHQEMCAFWCLTVGGHFPRSTVG